ncbi:putative iron-regulated membrane protein [Actinoplanes octamycinicus]|uniref:Putative iron-regulated membrane protein n=1 Tax=Actinoplanes octamycinicus TaxID=135948 RepID=A0A7W7GZ26_9ACTN|nr:hypothetical protein [Actinoplanes octamycinicus]MBB4740936.1 putative iron-regulated membrane protein [Actinoplanes octamycinicus]GIE55843.1 hypothetical protein Aoc01nite_12450 [Actinoplanes octamycinicus]
MMMIVIVALTGLVVALGLAFWPWPRRRPVPRHTGRLVAPPPPLPDSLEGVLTAQLLAGEISSQQYVRALERIAARDERRHPMSVPRDYRP